LKGRGDSKGKLAGKDSSLVGWQIELDDESDSCFAGLGFKLGSSSQFKHSPRAFDNDELNHSENTDEYSICMTRLFELEAGRLSLCWLQWFAAGAVPGPPGRAPRPSMGELSALEWRRVNLEMVWLAGDLAADEA